MRVVDFPCPLVQGLSDFPLAEEADQSSLPEEMYITEELSRRKAYEKDTGKKARGKEPKPSTPGRGKKTKST